MRDLRVNKTELTSEKTFTVDHFALGGKEKIKYYKRNLFWSFSQRVDLSLNPLLPNAFFLTILVLTIFW